METPESPRRLFHPLIHSDPTYEAWKLIGTKLSKRSALAFRSYLRGMETLDNMFGDRASREFRSYLRGMETKIQPHINCINRTNSDPTYEAWKLLITSNFWRKSRAFRSYLRGMETARRQRGPAPRVPDSDPTYEAWKLVTMVNWIGPGKEFRSYLRGMETVHVTPYRRC